MRIVSWNCCQAFRKKWEYIDAFEPDVIVVPEAECIAKQPADLLDRYPNHDWIGDNDNKGLLVLATSEYALTRYAGYRTEHRYVLPLQVNGAQGLFLVAVWTQRDKIGTYTQHLSRALEAYAPMLDGDAVVIGDFNANKIWDGEHRRDVTHSENVAWLNAHGLESAYHVLTSEAQGQESAATHAFRRDRSNTFHIDFAFATRRLLEAGSLLTIPAVEDWVGMSDHGPLIVDLTPAQGYGANE